MAGTYCSDLSIKHQKKIRSEEQGAGIKEQGLVAGAEESGNLTMVGLDSLVSVDLLTVKAY